MRTRSPSLAADLTTGPEAREELDELEEFLDDLEGSTSAREAVRTHLRTASAVIGMQILMSAYDDAVAAANTIINFFEQRPGVLTRSIRSAGMTAPSWYCASPSKPPHPRHAVDGRPTRRIYATASLAARRRP
jgi:hypothetical protein